MQIGVGSLNQTKINAVQAVFNTYKVIANDVASDVPAQPLGDEETRQGAINRARHMSRIMGKGLAIGLEGGVMNVAGNLFLCNWGAMITPKGFIYTAAGARIQLPSSFRESLSAGQELSVLMDAYTDKTDIRSHEGAIGIFTNNQIRRAEMFTHVVTLLKGQMEYWESESDPH